MVYTPTLNDLRPDLNAIGQEFIRARKIHRKFKSRHEAYAILLEEVEELWDMIKGNYPIDMVKKESTQVAAMALGILFEFDD